MQRDIEFINCQLRTNDEGGTLIVNCHELGRAKFQIIHLSREDLAELGDFLKPFVEQEGNDDQPTWDPHFDDQKTTVTNRK